MFNSEVLDSVKALIAPVLEKDNYCLVDASFSLRGKEAVLRLLIDRIQGGVNLNECAALNEKIGNIIEEKGIMQHSYMLEVFSPGIDRPLVTKEDFLRCIDRKIRIFLNQCQGAKNEISGVVVSVSDTGININSEGRIQQIPFERINKAKQII
ncbi:MAG: ribosome maturation factor RimP [Candidatus Omnitrophota bacterium]